METQSNRKRHFKIFGRAGQAIRALFRNDVPVPRLPAKSYENLRQHIQNNNNVTRGRGVQLPNGRKQYILHGTLTLQETSPISGSGYSRPHKHSSTSAPDHLHQAEFMIPNAMSNSYTLSQEAHLNEHQTLASDMQQTEEARYLSPSTASQHVAVIKSAVQTMPLGQLLIWITENYSFQGLLPEAKRYSTAIRRKPLPPLPQNLYHRLLTLKIAYNPKHSIVGKAYVYDVMSAIYCELKWLQMIIDHKLDEIDKAHELELREFVAWAYNTYEMPKSRNNRFSTRFPWNPHKISSDSRVIQEAIAYYEQDEFLRDESDLCICAKHIVCVLRGGRDWRERRGSRLVSQHPTPGQIAALQAMLSKHSLRG